MEYWLLKTEPEEYSFADLEKEGRAVWDGVKNNWALKHLRSMKSGDRALIYHSGKEKAIAGIAEIVSAPYPDPVLGDIKRTVIDVRAVRKFSGDIRLKKIKGDPFFKDFLLVKFTRLSVMPVAPKFWRKLLSMEGLEDL